MRALAGATPGSKTIHVAILAEAPPHDLT